ncbi:nucleotidyltransferase family protein [Micrococcoides hystricis]|uniref:NTP transferase domain-containing protein n=1 Tax=Micrococcoides hystricis TaxID=1572761 RepID=A0ABV6PB02_9MICC
MIAVILAAGAGRRLGKGPKALVQLGHSTLAERATATAIQAGLTPLVLAAPQVADTLRTLLAPDADVQAVPDHASGISASIKQAARRLHQAHPHEPVMLWLVDQPGITVDVIKRISAAHQAGTITRASYEGVPAHPVLFDPGDFQQAAESATGNVGAKEFLRMHRHRVTLIECGDIGSAADLDTAEDYRRWAEAFEA